MSRLNLDWLGLSLVESHRVRLVIVQCILQVQYSSGLTYKAATVCAIQHSV